ncbi:MAG: 2-dehydropantoate 2-reductase [Myxococcota bacterium]
MSRSRERGGTDVDIAIWGAGSVGLGLATCLAREGERLLVVGRDPATLEHVRRDGLARSGLFGERHVPPEGLTLVTDPTALVAAAPDWILICTKAFAATDVAAALAPIASDLPGSTRLVLCQNGWGNEAPFRSFWPTERLLHARVITGFHRRSPNHVEITAHASPIAFGSVFDLDPGSVPGLETLVGRIREGGIPAETTADMRAVLWGKMLYNCALNPIGALTGRRYGELTEDATTRRIVDGVIREIFAVLAAAGMPSGWPDAATYLRHFHDVLIPPTARHESSMLQDLRAGRPTEIEALAGAVERLGREHGVETPIVSGLAALVRAAERPD